MKSPHAPAPSEPSLTTGNCCSDFLPPKIILPVLDFHMNGIIQYVLFCVLLFFLRFIRVVAGISSWLLFNCWVAFQYMRMPQFTYLNVSMDVWFGPSFCSVSFLIADLFVNSDLTFDLDLTLTWIMNWVPTLT